MQGIDQILGSSGMDLGSLAAKFGLSPEQASSAMGSLMPAIAGGFQKRADDGSLGAVTDTANGIGQPDTDTGNNVLGQIFGGKDVSRQVADHAAGQTGLSSTVMKAMLPVVAAMVAKHMAGNGGAGSSEGGTGEGGLGGILGSVLGGGGGGGLGGLGNMLGGGNPLDAILGGRR